jgi:TetR/AcrR family transcriptional regulator, tetracycline repressor protein
MATVKPARDIESAPRRGRPARFSRDQIVEAVADMLLADPSAPLTIARAAEAVGAKPMSLYRHFSDRDDLVAAVARHLFAGTRPRVATGATWQVEVGAWMTAIYHQARRVPQIVQLLASGESAEWLGDSAYLAGVFERAGCHDDRVLAEAVYWVATATMGHAMIDAAGRSQDQIDHLRASLERLDPDEAALNERLIPQFDRLRDHGFELVVDLTIAGLEQLLAR